MNAIVTAALATMRAANPSCAASLVYEGRTANGVIDKTSAQGAATGYGEQGRTTGRIFVSPDDVDRPPNGASATVRGEDVIVLDSDLSGGVFLRVDYAVQRRQAGV